MSQIHTHLIKEKSKKYRADFGPDSRWYIAAPNEHTTRFPFWIMESGYFDAGKSYQSSSQSGVGYWLGYVIEGRCRVTYNGDVSYHGENTLLLLDCAAAIDVAAATKDRFKLYWLWGNGEGIHAFESLFYDGENALVISDQKKIVSIFSKIVHEQDSQSQDYALEDNLNITQLFTSIMQIKQGSQEKDTSSNYVQKVINYIRSHWREDLTVDDLSEMTAVSKYHLIREFKEAVGVTPYQYIIHMRVNYGQILLRTTNQSIRDISSQLGYDSPSYFAKQFKQIVGLTPLEYRHASLYTSGKEVKLFTRNRR